MPIQFPAPLGLVPIERHWLKVLVALFHRLRPGTGFRKSNTPREAQSWQKR